MKKILLTLLLISVGCTSMAQRSPSISADKQDYLVETNIQNTIANHAAVRSFVSSLKLEKCSLPKEIPNAQTMCTLMGSDNRCNFTFTFECANKDENNNYQKEKISGAGSYDEKTQKVDLYQVMLDSWRDGQDWISHLKPSF